MAFNWREKAESYTKLVQNELEDNLKKDRIEIYDNMSEELDKLATKSETGSLRYNGGKLPMHLVPPSAINALADILDYGANKYEERNWEKGNNYSVPYASLMRHLLAWWSGEDKDPESGKSHVHHVLMNAAMLVEYEEKFPELDDRPGKIND